MNDARINELIKWGKDMSEEVQRLRAALTHERARLKKAIDALQLASNDERLQASGQDDYVLCQVRTALDAARKPAESPVVS